MIKYEINLKRYISGICTFLLRSRWRSCPSASDFLFANFTSLFDTWITTFCTPPERLQVFRSSPPASSKCFFPDVSITISTISFKLTDWTSLMFEYFCLYLQCLKAIWCCFCWTGEFWNCLWFWCVFCVSFWRSCDRS